jgi:uncharacterized protein YggE
MKRREAIAVTGTVVTAALSGCFSASSEGDTNGSGSNGGLESGRTVVVSKTGEVDGEPDLAVLRLGIQSTADNAGDVRDELASGADELRSALREYGIDEENVTTQRYRIRKRYDRRRMEEAGVRPGTEEAKKYVTYHGTHSFSVELEDIDAVGEVIDVAVGAGVNQIDRVTYTLSEEKRAELRREALRKALQKARSEAETIANEIGAAVVEATVVDASEGRVSPVRRHVAQEAAATPTGDAGGQPTSIESGDVTVTADVNVRYRIE